MKTRGSNSRAALSAVFVVTIALVLTIILIPQNTSGQVEGILSVTGEEKEDFEGDGIFDALNLELSFNPTEAGDYALYAKITNSGGIMASNSGSFSPGTYNVTLRFDGSEIYQKGLEGRFKIEIYVLFEGELLGTLDYLTKEYTMEDFSPYPSEGKGEEFQLYMKENSVIIEGKVFTAVVKTDEPEIYYYYTSDMGEGARFRIEYTNAVLYQDHNNNQRYEDGEEFAEYSLDDLDWSMRLNLLEGYERYDFSVTGTNGGYASNGGIDLNLGFHYSSAMRSSEDWDRQKFDIDIYVDGNVPESYRIALFQDIVDETGGNTIGELIDGEEEGRIYYYNRDGEKLGYYAYLKEANFYKGDIESLGTETIAVEGYLAETGDASKRTMVMDYRLNGTGRLHHDPTIGMNPALQPILDAATEMIRHQPLLFLATALVSGAVVFHNLKRKRK